MNEWRREERDSDISPLSAAALVVFMPANRDGRCTGHFFLLHCLPFNFPGRSGGRKRGASGSYAKRRCFLYACQRVSKASVRVMFFF